jgi:hypothetical protein
MQGSAGKSLAAHKSTKGFTAGGGSKRPYTGRSLPHTADKKQAMQVCYSYNASKTGGFQAANSITNDLSNQQYRKKLVPMTMHYDPESLYDQNIQVKVSNNEI